MATIDFWYSIGSTYTYLTVMRLPGVARETDVSFRWRPFNVRHVMVTQNNVPFRDKPEKSAHMWRDIQRRAARYGLTPRIPAPYPLPGLVLANQVALLGAESGWCEAYTRAAYRNWFDDGHPAGEQPNLSASLTEIGLDPDHILREATSDRIVTALGQATQAAMDLGVFGSPSFVADGELFWGDDRLDDAIEWARRGTLG